MQPYLAVRVDLGEWNIYEVKYFAAPLTAYISAPDTALAWGRLTSGLAHGEAQLFPGLTLYGLAAVGTWGMGARGMRLGGGVGWWAAGGVALLAALCVKWAGGSAALVRAAAVAGFFWPVLAIHLAGLYRAGRTDSAPPAHPRLMAFVGVVFAFGSFGILVGPGDGGFDPGLGHLLYRFAPGFDSLRAQSRMGIPALLAVCTLAGLGAERVLDRYPRGVRRAAVYAGLLALIGWESRIAPAGAAPPPVAPPVLERFAKVAGPEAVLMLPVEDPRANPNFAVQQVRYLLQLLPVERPIVNGYSGRMPPSIYTLGGATRDFPDAASLEHLETIPGLRYIVYDGSALDPRRRAAFEKASTSFPARLRLADRDEEGFYLLQLGPRAAP